MGASAVNTLRASYSDFKNSIVPVSPGPPAHLPEHPGRGQLPGAAGHGAEALAARRLGVLGEGRPHAALRRRGRAHLRSLRPRCLPRRARRAGAGLRAVRPQPRRPRRRQRPAVRGHAPERQARPEPHARRLQQQLLRGLRAGRLARHVRSSRSTSACATSSTRNVKNISGYADTNPIVAPFYQGERRRDLEQHRPAAGLRLDQQGGHVPAPRRLRSLLRPRDARDHVARARARRPRAAGRGARGQRVLPGSRDRQRAALRSDLRRSLHRASSCPARGPRASTSSTTRCENPTVQQYNLGTRFRVPGDAVLQLDLVHNRGTHFIIGRPVGEVYNPVVGGPDRVVNLESSVGTRYDALLATLEKRWGAGQQLRVVLHAWPAPGTTRTTTRSRSAAGRSTRTTWSASTARPRTSSDTAWCSRARSCCRSSCGSPASGRSHRRCRWTS